MTAFCTSSKLARPETCSTVPRSGSRPSRAARPMTLSTALCRPTSSRTTIGAPSPRRRAPPRAGPRSSRRPPAGRAGAPAAARAARHPRPRRRHRSGTTRPCGRRRSTLPADAARAGRIEGARHLGRGRGDAGSERDVENVVGVLLAARAGSAAVDRRGELVAARDDPLRDEEARRELDIVARGAHRHRERRPSDADLEGLLDGESIGGATFASPSVMRSTGRRATMRPTSSPIAFMPRCGWRTPDR